MSIPRKVKIAGIDVQVQFADMEGKWGDFDQDKCIIRLCKTLKEKPQMAKITLLHEMAHASLRLTGVNECMEGDVEEAVVRNFEQILFPAIEKLLIDSS